MIVLLWLKTHWIPLASFVLLPLVNEVVNRSKSTAAQSLFQLGLQIALKFPGVAAVPVLGDALVRYSMPPTHVLEFPKDPPHA